MAHGILKKVEIKDDVDARKKIKRDFFISKSLFNQIVDTTYKEDTTFSKWVYDACKQKMQKEIQVK